MRATVRQKGTSLFLILWLVLASAGPLVTRGAAPAACAAATHTCSCSPDPHGAAVCCCAQPDEGEEAAALCRLSCTGSEPVVSLPTPTLPPGMLSPRLAWRPAAPAYPRVRASAPPVRARSVSPGEPPPELTA